MHQMMKMRMKMKRKSSKISRTLNPNTDMRAYHFTLEISENRAIKFERPLRPSSNKYLESIGLFAAVIVRQLFEIDGISTVFVYPYRIEIVKAELYRWHGRNGIERQIVRAIREVFRANDMRLITTGDLVQQRRKPKPTLEDNSADTTE